MHLRISFARGQISKKLDLWIKNNGETKNLGEVWARRVSVGANEEELTT
jgi:hypothetical protein